ncbi:uncharacterized protein LOC106162507 [Lingula anatina]|uniref:Uncharacterized protein LOC106162507 n=1 Tax=Lingula anatina TaxID=7574 RepID=A0A1S3IAH9_LINAN|nr:uncharacterized protein LOC106162507 [Lingula anatina]|eukprot:XP_013395267.1 uncharacterized protein LOC106162507 [Lingula anatina]
MANPPSPQSSGSDMDCEIINLDSNFITFEDIQENYMPGADIFVTYRIGKHFIPSSCDWIGLFGADWIFPSQVLTYRYAPQGHSGHPHLRSVLFDARSLPADNNEASYQFLYIARGDQVIGTSKLFKIHTFIPETDLVNFEFVDHSVDFCDPFTVIKTAPSQKGILRSFEVIKDPEFDFPVVRRCSSDHITLTSNWSDQKKHWTDLLKLELDLSESSSTKDSSTPDEPDFLDKINPDLFHCDIGKAPTDDHWKDLLNIDPDIFSYDYVKSEKKKEEKKVTPCEPQAAVTEQALVPYVPIYTSSKQTVESKVAVNPFIQSLLVLALAKISQRARYKIEKPLTSTNVMNKVASSTPSNTEDKPATKDATEKKPKALSIKCHNCRRRLKNFLRLKRQQVDLQNKITDLESQLEASDSLLLSKNILMEEFSKQVKSLVSENGKLVAINEKLYEEKVKADKENKIKDILQQSVDRLTFSIKMDSLEQDKKQLTKEVQSLKAQIRNLMKLDEVKKLKKEMHRLRSCLFSEELKITFLTKEKEDQCREIATLKRQLRQKEAEFDFAWAQKREQTSQLDEAKQMIQNGIYIISSLYARGFHTVNHQEEGHKLDIATTLKIAGVDAENPLYYPDIVVPVAVKSKLSELIQKAVRDKAAAAKSQVQCPTPSQDIQERITSLNHALDASALVTSHFQKKCKHAAIPLPPKVPSLVPFFKPLPLQYSDVVKMDPPATKTALTTGLTSVMDTVNTEPKKGVKFDEMVTVKVEETLKKAAVISQVADVRPKTPMGKQKTVTENRASHRYKPYDRKSGKRSQSQEVREIIRDLSAAEEYSPLSFTDQQHCKHHGASSAAGLARMEDLSLEEEIIASGGAASPFAFISADFPQPKTSLAPAAVDINNNVEELEEEEDLEGQEVSWGSFTDLANRKRPASPVATALEDGGLLGATAAVVTADNAETLPLESQHKVHCTSPTVSLPPRCKKPARKFVRYYRKNCSKGGKSSFIRTSSQGKTDKTKVGECLGNNASSEQKGNRDRKRPFRSSTAGQRWNSSFHAYSGSSE